MKLKEERKLLLLLIKDLLRKRREENKISANKETETWEETNIPDREGDSWYWHWYYSYWFLNENLILFYLINIKLIFDKITEIYNINKYFRMENKPSKYKKLKPAPK